MSYPKIYFAPLPFYSSRQFCDAKPRKESRIRESSNDMALKEQQKRFCREYVIDCNATQAALRAGYAKNTARQQGSRLLTNVDVNAETERLSASV